MDLKDKIVISNGKIRPVALEYLQDKVTLKSWQQRGRVPEEQWKEWLQEADALYSTGNIRIDETLLQKAPKLRVVAQASVGYDNIDVEACNAHNVKIGNTPGVLVNAVADIAYGLLIDTARNIVRGHLHTKNGLWGERKALGLGVDLYNKTLGIVGFGDIGSAIAKRAQASGMRIIYHNRNRRLNDAALGARYVSWEELLKTSDFIVVAVTLNPSTRGMFDEAAFAAMKDGVRSAGLDVTEPEPLPGDHPLLTLPNITVTPHIASATEETRDEMALVTAQNIIAALSGQPMLAQVK